MKCEHCDKDAIGYQGFGCCAEYVCLDHASSFVLALKPGEKRSLANATLNGSELTVLKPFKKVYEPGGEMKRSPGPSFYTISPPIILYSYTVLVPVMPETSGQRISLPAILQPFLYGGPYLP